MNDEIIEQAIRIQEEQLTQLKRIHEADSTYTYEDENINISDAYRTTMLLHPDQKEWAYEIVEGGSVQTLEKLYFYAVEYARRNHSSFMQFAIERSQNVAINEILRMDSENEESTQEIRTDEPESTQEEDDLRTDEEEPTQENEFPEDFLNQF